MAKKYALGKNERLKSRKQIERLFAEGRKISVFPLHIYYLEGELVNERRSVVLKNSLGQLPKIPSAIRVGVGVSGKVFKKAVNRNRIKRLLREAYRLQKQDLCEAVNANNRRLDLFFIYTAKDFPSYKLVYDRMAVALQKISTEIDKRSRT